MKKNAASFLVLMVASLAIAGFAWGDGGSGTTPYGSPTNGSTSSASGKSTQTGFSGTGTLTVTVTYNGAALSGAYVYLQDGSKSQPPMLQYLQAPNQIIGPSSSTGVITATKVPAGRSFVMVMKRGTYKGKLGPAQPGDYTWIYTGNPPVITINNGATVALGSVNTSIFSAAGTGVTISGTVKGSSGAALAGWSVKVTTVPCGSGGYGHAYSYNQCGSVRYPTVTDANGNFSVSIGTAGTYYVYASPYLMNFMALPSRPRLMVTRVAIRHAPPPAPGASTTPTALFITIVR